MSSQRGPGGGEGGGGEGGGEGGGNGDGMRGPQSVQSRPRRQEANWAPGPPSSHQPSELWKPQLSSQSEAAEATAAIASICSTHALNDGPRTPLVRTHASVPVTRLCLPLACLVRRCTKIGALHGSFHTCGWWPLLQEFCGCSSFDAVATETDLSKGADNCNRPHICRSRLLLSSET